MPALETADGSKMSTPSSLASASTLFTNSAPSERIFTAAAAPTNIECNCFAAPGAATSPRTVPSGAIAQSASSFATPRGAALTTPPELLELAGVLSLGVSPVLPGVGAFSPPSFFLLLQPLTARSAARVGTRSRNFMPQGSRRFASGTTARGRIQALRPTSCRNGALAIALQPFR